jgi:hypothetical protein
MCVEAGGRDPEVLGECGEGHLFQAHLIREIGRRSRDAGGGESLTRHTYSFLWTIGFNLITIGTGEPIAD